MYIKTIENIKDYFYNRKSRNRMKKLFNKFYSFDIVGVVPDVLFGMLIEFYENSNIEFVDWEYDKVIKNKRKRIDKIYLYAKFLRKKWLNKADHVLSLSTLEMKFKPCEDNCKCSEIYFENESVRNKKIHDIYNWIENFIWECDNKYCKEIIELRGKLWI